MILKTKNTSDHYNHMNQLIQKKKKKQYQKIKTKKKTKKKKKKKLMTKDLAKEP